MNVEPIVGPESENQRNQRLSELAAEQSPDWEKLFAPGSFGCHELLDRTSMLANTVEEYVLEHPSCALDAEWYALARRAVTALCDLYQKIGAADASVDEPSAP